jgi:transcriptional regulator with XRE-family HTH domain
MSQEENVTQRHIGGFGVRLATAFQGRTTKQVAEALGVTYYGARNYLEGRVPGPAMLLKISDVTGCSIHWLLTGEGPPSRSEWQSDENSVLFTDYRSVQANLLAEGKDAAELAVLEYLSEQLRTLSENRRRRRQRDRPGEKLDGKGRVEARPKEEEKRRRKA